MFRIAVLFLSLFHAVPDVQASSAEQYRLCMEQARSAPGRALQTAKTLEGPAAGHCDAIALMTLGRYGESAARLRHLAAQTAKTDLRVHLLGQAAQALLLDSQPEEAETVLDEAIGLAPTNVELLVDRGVARADQFRYVDAVRDFDQAIALAPGNADGYLFRASALRHLDKLPLAMKAVETALRLAPTSAEALLERGILRRLTGDRYGARADWQQVMSIAPGSEAAQSAVANIERVDNPPELQPPPQTPPPGQNAVPGD